jgi:4-hydroxysphinganine ceramide fatty acyl 2-hydroxylase
VTTFATHHPGGGVLLRNFNLKNVDEQMKFHHPLTLMMANSMVIGTFKKEISRIINPDQPLLPQIWNLDHESYLKVINSPHWLFVPSPRMFEWSFFEFFSHNKWFSITVLPFLVIFSMFYSIESWESFNLPLTILTALIGFLFFTLTEYCLHRFVFHSESILPNSRTIRYLHYIMHGIHHMLPNDP